MLDLHQTGSVGEGSDHLQLIKFWPSCAPGKGSTAGRIFLAPPYYTASAQCLRLSERFFIIMVLFKSRCDVWRHFCSRVSTITYPGVPVPNGQQPSGQLFRGTATTATSRRLAHDLSNPRRLSLPIIISSLGTSDISATSLRRFSLSAQN